MSVGDVSKLPAVLILYLSPWSPYCMELLGITSKLTLLRWTPPIVHSQMNGIVMAPSPKLSSNRTNSSLWLAASTPFSKSLRNKADNPYRTAGRIYFALCLGPQLNFLWEIQIAIGWNYIDTMACRGCVFPSNARTKPCESRNATSLVGAFHSE